MFPKFIILPLRVSGFWAILPPFTRLMAADAFYECFFNCVFKILGTACGSGLELPSRAQFQLYVASVTSKQRRVAGMMHMEFGALQN